MFAGYDRYSSERHCMPGAQACLSSILEAHSCMYVVLVSERSLCMCTPGASTAWTVCMQLVNVLGQMDPGAAGGRTPAAAGRGGAAAPARRR